MATDETDRSSWAITEQPIPLPQAVVGSDPATAYRGLMVAHGELENRREDEGRAAEKSLMTLLTDLVGVLDALDRALASAHERGDAAASSLSSTRRRLARVLRRQGVEQVEQVGRPVDPETSDVEDVEDSPDLPAETVVRETVAAYARHGATIRRGSVIVSTRPATEGRTPSAPQS